MSLTKDDKAILRVYDESTKKDKAILPIDEATKKAGVTGDRSQTLINLDYLKQLKRGYPECVITQFGREQLKPWYAQPWHVWIIIALAAIAAVAGVVTVFR